MLWKRKNVKFKKKPKIKRAGIAKTFECMTEKMKEVTSIDKKKPK